MSMTGKTIRLRRTLRALDHPLIILGVVIDIVLIATICVQVSSPPAPGSTMVEIPTLGPIILIATAQPTPAAQVVAAGPNTLTRSIVGYWTPDTTAEPHVLDAGQHYAFLAKSGADWVQIAVSGNPIWVRSAELIGLPDLADLATATPAPQIAVVSAPAAPEQQYQVDAAPTPTACYHSERQAMVHGVSVGLATGDSCISQQLADEQAAQSAFAQMNAALQGGK